MKMEEVSCSILVNMNGESEGGKRKYDLGLGLVRCDEGLCRTARNGIE